MPSRAGYPDRAGGRSSTSRPAWRALRDLVDWRFGMAHTAPFLAGLSPDERATIRREAEAAVAGMPPLVVEMIVLTAR